MRTPWGGFGARRPRRSGDRTVAVVALALLAAVSIGLAAFAMQSQRASVSVSGELTTPVFGDADPAPENPAEPPEPTVIQAVPPQRLLSAGAESGHVVRALTGACAVAPGQLQVSFDGGQGWSDATLPGALLAPLQQIDASDATVTRLVYLQEECGPALARSFTGGMSWEYTEEAGAVWFLTSMDQGRAATAQTPAGSVVLPCSAVALSAEQTQGIVLCEDSSVSVSNDSGVTWSQPFPVPSAAAVGVGPGAFVIASHNELECAGVRTRILTSEGLGEPSTCLEVEAPAGDLAVAAAPGVQYVWVGERFARLADGGGSWV